MSLGRKMGIQRSNSSAHEYRSTAGQTINIEPSLLKQQAIVIACITDHSRTPKLVKKYSTFPPNKPNCALQKIVSSKWLNDQFLSGFWNLINPFKWYLYSKIEKKKKMYF